MRLINADAMKESMISTLERIKRNPKMDGHEKDIIAAIVALSEMIDDTPTVDAVPVRHGSWIDMDVETYTWKIRCSRCGHERGMMSTGKTYPMWCENCGARMDRKDGNDGRS